MTALLNLDTIIIPEDRQRTEPAEKHINELASSIIANGLINPITVTQDRTLVAGFCRLSAIRLLFSRGESFVYDRKEVPLGQIPVLLASSEEKDVLFRIELEENVRRKNLTPAENAKALARLHELFKAGKPEWTQKDTASVLTEHELFDSQNSAEVVLSRSLIIASQSDDEEVKGAKTVREAYAIARRKTEANLLHALGELLTEEEPASYCTLIEDKYRNAILPDNTFDCIIVDPPYGINAGEFGEQAKSGGHFYDDSEAAFWSAIQYLTSPELIRACKAQMHLFCFLDIRNFFRAADFLTREGSYYVWPTPLIWAKNTAHLPQPDLGPKRSYEAILFASRGRKTVRRHGSDVLSYGSEPNKVHPAQKPVALYRELLSWSCSAGDSVLDFCCGSGTIFAAVKDEAIYATGIEVDSAMAKIARTRM